MVLEMSKLWKFFYRWTKVDTTDGRTYRRQTDKGQQSLFDRIGCVVSIHVPTAETHRICCSTKGKNMNLCNVTSCLYHFSTEGQMFFVPISYGIARILGPLSDTDNSSFYISFVCVWGGWGGYGLFQDYFPYFEQIVNQCRAENGVRGSESVAELGVSHVIRARLLPIAVRI